MKSTLSLFLLALVAGCARVDVETDRRALARATPCCASRTTTVDAKNNDEFRNVVPLLVFLDAEGRRLPTVQQPRPVEVLHFAGTDASTTWAAVPTGARTLVVATHRDAVDRRFAGCMRPGGGGEKIALDRCIVYPAGTLQDEWHGAIYGLVKILPLAASPAP